MRQSDVDEVKASSALSPEDALIASYRVSTHAYLVLSTADGGTPVAAFGAAPHPLPGVGVVWMLGTDGIKSEGYSIAKATRRYFDELNAAYHILWNYIDARNTTSMRRSEEHTSELQSPLRISYAVFCLKKKKKQQATRNENK